MRVVIAGGGVAAIETLLALRALVGHVVDVTLLAPEPEFLYRPVTVAEAFERGQARSFKIEDITRSEPSAQSVRAALREVDPDARTITTSGGERLGFDVLVIATGAMPRPPLPGALTFRGRADVPVLRQMLDALLDGTARSAAFALPRERMWPLPIYELALLSAAHVHERRRGSKIAVVTPEDEILSLFGDKASEALGPLLAARGIEVHRASMPAAVEGRALVLAGGAKLYADRVVTLPVLEGPRVPGVPHDHDGFIPTDAHGLVAGLTDIYAAGDVTAFPIKQGGLATQQADAVAEMIAARAGVDLKPRPFTPVLRGLLLTGGAPLYLRCEPQRLDRTATVAIDAPARRRGERNGSAAGSQPLWWPPAKIAGRFLGPYLATARPDLLRPASLVDRVPVHGRPPSESEYEDALQLALLLADCDARWGDYDSALSALDAAEVIAGTLPATYEAKRRSWQDAARAAR
jgi:sulfide:quinone oxidoreductase